MPEITTAIQESVQIRGPVGSLEGMLTYPVEQEPGQAILIVGPHPMLGGDFNNNVVAHLAEQLTESAAVTLRFNFRGVGQSAGEPIISTANISQFWTTSRIDAEMEFAEDVKAAGEFLQATFGQVNCVVGYSFGAYLASQWAMQVQDLSNLTMIAPTIDQHDYSDLQELNIPKLVITSFDDFAVPIDKLKKSFQQWKSPKQLIIEQVDNHFFRGHEKWLTEKIISFHRGNER